MSSIQKPLVAIRTITFNHKPYLRDYFEGVVMQRTNFHFVAVVHDDCSTDGSSEIIKEYTERYPDIIKPIFEKENQWSKHDGSLARIMNDAIGATNAKYVAICEGDDYWTDPYKLQKQVDFLETHPEYDMVCGRFDHLIHETGEIQNYDLYDGIINSKEMGVELTHEHFYQAAIPHPCTVMYRSGTTEDDDLLPRLKFCYDIPRYYCFMRHHRVWLMNQKMAVYRKHEGSLTTRSGLGKTITFYETYKDIYQYEKSRVIHYLLQHYTWQVTSAYIRYIPKIEWTKVSDYIHTYKMVTPSSLKRFQYWVKIVKSYIVRYTKGLKYRENSVTY